MKVTFNHEGNTYYIEDDLKLLGELKAGKSLIRFGDGEFAVMWGKDIYFQKSTQRLKEALKEIVVTEDPRFAVAFFYNKKEQLNFLRPGKIYYDTLISRCRNPSIVSTIISLFTNRNVVVVHNCKDGRIAKAVRRAKSVKWVVIPEVNCFDEYDDILKQCTAEDVPKDAIFYVACGPTAKLLCWDLGRQGYQALDLGRFHYKLKKKMFRTL